MKRILALLFVVLMALSVVSCTTEPATEGDATTAAPTTTQSAANGDTTTQPAGGDKTQVTTVATTVNTPDTPATPEETTEKKTEWKPIIYTKPQQGKLPANYGEAAKNPKAVSSTIKNLLGADKKSVGATHTSPVTNTTYKLKFVDDFNGTTLNTSNWTYYTRNYNAAEQSVNRKENVNVKDGSLVITGKKEDRQYTGSAETWETPKTSYFTGGAINSQGKKEYTYGRLEIMAKLPYSYGMWPAFWTQGTNRGWPWGGEIDIMEFVGGVDQWNNYRDDEYNSGLHWCDPKLGDDKAWSTGLDVKLTDPDSVWNRTDTKMSTGGKFELLGLSAKGGTLADEWRICGLEWTKDKMYFYCNDEVYLTIDITKTSMREAYHKNHYMILNLVMGGSWAGTPDEAKGTVWPQEFKVEWVKVWQK
ncbi:MAG: glycoside hydrolase family 16 protein [Clostridia bacterium]|nr:glycoside hydrolase family 16 protein [Clostridia bacterium]